MAARLGGGHDAELCEAATGVDLNYFAVSLRARRAAARPSGQQRPRRRCLRRLSRRPGRTAPLRRRGRRGAAQSRASAGCGSTAGRLALRAAPPRRRSGRRRPRCRERRAPTLSSAPAVRPRPYASWSMRLRRSTRLGFQPPAIGDEEIEAVTETLRSGWLTTGPRRLSSRSGGRLPRGGARARRRVGHRALHLALLAVGVGPGDEVITSPITWPATANVIEHCGAQPGVLRRPALRPQHRSRACLRRS